jgi:hypothetical protein
MESRLQSRPEISKQYHKFLHEYLEFDHMESVTEGATTLFKSVYIPHHAVIRESSSTTKLRVVFNTSCKTRNGTSLNDPFVGWAKATTRLAGHSCPIASMALCVYCGHRQNVPSDLDRTHGYWFSASFSDWTLNFRCSITVTYGLAPAPYLGYMLVLKQLAIDDGYLCPAAVPIIKSSIYVDDTLFGKDNIHELHKVRD